MRNIKRKKVSKRRKDLHNVAFDTQIYNGKRWQQKLVVAKNPTSPSLVTKIRQSIQMQFKFTYSEPLGIPNYLPFHANLATIFLTNKQRKKQVEFP